MLSPEALHALQSPSSVIFVDTSQDFARGHVPGARWVARGWLDLSIGDFVPSKSTAVTVTCVDGRSAVLAGATLRGLGYERVSVLDGGMTAWQKAGLPVERGLSGVMSPPADVVPYGPDRNSADMQNYLRWEEELGRKYEVKKPG
jgi:rhodanese-related sulfurtransferase